MLRKPVETAAAAAVALSLVAVQERQAEGTRGSFAAEVRLARIRLGTGVELQVAEKGRADGEPVLFLHGFPDAWLAYSPVLDELPSNVRAIVPTQRGHGDSEHPACCYAVANFAADAVALLDALGIERATVVGHSMGSFIAQRIAIERPERVKQLVLIGSGTTPRTPAVLEFNDVVQQLNDPIAPAFVRDFQESTVFKPVPAAFIDRLVRESEKLPARVWRDVMAGLVAADAKHELNRIQASTLIVWGDRDPLWTRPEQDGLVRAIRAARQLTYVDAGHSPHWEQPARFAADLLDFLAEQVAPVAASARNRADQYGTKRPGGAR